MKNKNKMKSVVMATLTMGLALGAGAADIAEVTINGTTTPYADVVTAWAACKDQNATLTLLANADITSTLDKNWVDNDLLLDLNGHTLRQTGSGCILNVHGKLTVENGVITRSSPFEGDGAGIFVCHNEYETDLTRLVMRGITMTNCVASKCGGAIYAQHDTQVMLENCTLRQNAAGDSGGGIYVVGGATETSTSPKDPWDKLILISTVITDNTAGKNGAGVAFKKTLKGASCFAAGTRVRMADGSVKKIEEVAEDDLVRTFDHEGGTNSSARVFLTVKESISTRIFVLSFAGGSSVRCVLSHDFLMKDGETCHYVCLNRENAADYVGKSFFAIDGQWRELLGVTDGESVDEVYEIYTSQHLNSYADGLLTVPSDVAHVLNIYKLDASIKADAAELAADIAAFGLADFAEMSEKYGMSRAYYDAFGVKYGYIIVGKGLMTLAQIEALYQSMQKSGAGGENVQPKRAALLTTTDFADESDPTEGYSTSCLTLGAGTIVTNNLVGSEPNNIYLLKTTDNSLVSLANDRADICAGVTLEWTNGQFSVFYNANPGDIALFRSDNAKYAVWYVSETGEVGSHLKLDEGSQILPPWVANTSYVVWKGEEIIAWNVGVAVDLNAENVRVVYTADDGYVFAGGVMTKEVSVNTSTTTATMETPDAPFEVAASVTANGVTTDYPTLSTAWDEACTIQKTGVDATVKMLKNATIESTLETGSNGALTLDLNDHVLAYTGESACIIQQSGGTLHVVDTATTRTPHYFTCEATGLWTLTPDETDLKVEGGLLTGGRNSAIVYCKNADVPHSISNVNFVGNASGANGGAVSTISFIIPLAITSCTFLGNVATENGGAVSSGILTMTDCRVEKNVASGTGGGIMVRNHGSLVRTTVVGNQVANDKAKGGGVAVQYNPGGCFPAGVAIRMADGSEKKVEEVVVGDVVSTFDHLGGTNSSAAVFYVYRGSGSQNVFTLSFASGAKLSIADRHDLLMETTRKYVTVASDNARLYLGRRFYNYAMGGWDELTGVTSEKDCDVHYSLYVREHANCVANGLLTVPDDKDCFVNVYDLDATLKADAEQLAADSTTYGLAQPSDYPNVPLADFADGNVRYARIAIGKGLTTQAEILFWNEYDYGPIAAKKAAFATQQMLIAPPSADYLQVGEGVVITGNVNATCADNVSLITTDAFGTTYNPVIDILPEATDLTVGVTLSSGSGVFGWTNTTDYTSSFISDDPSYRVLWTTDCELALVSSTDFTDVQVGDDAWASIYKPTGLCSISGTSDMWSFTAPGLSPLWKFRDVISKVIVRGEVTGVGANALSYMSALKTVEIGGTVTNIAAKAFYHCTDVTNLVVGSGVVTVGDNAFERNYSLTTVHFGTKAAAEACQRAFKITARITMDGETPIVDAVPEVVIDGWNKVLQGKTNLTDSAWIPLDEKQPIPYGFHFFKYDYVEE